MTNRTAAAQAALDAAIADYRNRAGILSDEAAAFYREKINTARAELAAAKAADGGAAIIGTLRQWAAVGGVR